jgi:4-hydroxy-tetrahydrodipicolinate synthase
MSAAKSLVPPLKMPAVPIYAGTAACSVREALLLSEDAADVGADAVILVPPFYFPLSEKAIYEFFPAVTAGVQLSVVVYNNPLYTGNAIPPKLLLELPEMPGVVGLKQSESNLGDLVEVLHQARARDVDCALLTGIDSQFLAALSVGAGGIFSTAPCLVPDRMVQVYDLARADDLARARELNYTHCSLYTLP